MHHLPTFFEMINELLLPVLLVSSLLSWVSDAQREAMTPGRLCPVLLSSPGHRGLTFLHRRTPLDHVVLYLAVWTQDDHRLVRCSVTSDPSITGEYLSLCKKENKEKKEKQKNPDALLQMDATVRGFNISTLLSPGHQNPCRELPSENPSRHKDDAAGGGEGGGDGGGGDHDPTSRTNPPVEVKSRRRRSWFFPGTLWCGTGSRAMDYNQLGMFESADRCCREHDHCEHIISSFTVKYGTLNTNLFTVSHCDCDHSFRECLLGVNDTISSMVGYSFFNIFMVPCFQLVQRRRCTQMSWWGRCKVSTEAPYAVLQRPSSFNTSSVTLKPTAAVSTCTEGHCPRTKGSKRKPKHKDASDPTPPSCRPSEPPRGDTFLPRKGKACRRRRTQQAASTPPSSSSVLEQQTTSSGTHSTPAPSSLKTQTVTVVTVVSGSKKKKNATGLRVAATSLSTSTAVTWTTTSSSWQSTTPAVSQTKVFHRPPVAVATLTTVASRRHKNRQRKRLRCVNVSGRGDLPWRKPCLKKPAKPHTAAPTIPLTDESPGQPTTVAKQRAKSSGAAEVSTTPSPPPPPPPPPQETTPGLSVTIPEIQMSGNPTGTANTVWDAGNSPRHAIEALENAEASLTGNLSQCTLLKILDECKCSIPALQKKYGLKNMESKTVYHCDCMSRLAVKMERMKPTKTILSLLVDFVSRRCFDLPKRKKCQNRKRCMRYFSQGPAVFQGLEQKVEKVAAAEKNVLHARKTQVIPVRFYKRCLRNTAPGTRG